MNVGFIGHILRPDFFDDDCVMFYRDHYWLWCLRMKRIKCLLGWHKWIDCGPDIGAYCDRCPMEKDADGTTHLADIGKS